MNASDPSIIATILKQQDKLTPELQRTAKWMIDHADQVGFLSMRHIAREAGVAPATVLRMAKALGFTDFNSLKHLFQKNLISEVGYKTRVASLQTAPDGNQNHLQNRLIEAQLKNVETNLTDHSASLLHDVAQTIASAKTVAFLGMRVSYGIAFQFFYAYQLIYNNGVLLQDQAGMVLDYLDRLDKNDVLIAISLAPYSSLTVEMTELASKAGIPVIALTDSHLSPIAKNARHVLRFRTETVSFVHSMVGALSLVEQLLAQLAVHGGQHVLERLEHVEQHLLNRHAYWKHKPSGRQ